jgi:3-oxoacyl-[acyl-carrier-protein] synthase II
VSDRRRVVITGIGMVTPLGNTVEESWAAVKASKSGVGPMTRIDPAEFPAKIAAEVKGFEPTLYMGKSEARKMALFTQFGVAAAVQALADAGFAARGEDGTWSFSGFDPDRTGCIVGNGIGGFEIIEEAYKKLYEKGPGSIPPMTIPELISNECPGNIAMVTGIKGPTWVVTTACASGTDAIGNAMMAIRAGMCELAVTGGSEAAITQMGVGGFAKLHTLTTDFNDRPERASRPFDRDRSGFVLGEGAGMLVIEELSHAKARGAKIYAELVGYGQTCDAYHLTSPDPEGTGAAKAFAIALKDAGMRPEDIDYINAHGTSTEINDPTETKAIKAVFGSHAKSLKVSSTKSMTGHMVAGGGGVEAIFSVLAIRDQYFPCTLNLENPGEGCDLDYVPNKGQSGRIRAALSDSLGFGGHNAAVIVREFKD